MRVYFFHGLGKRSKGSSFTGRIISLSRSHIPPLRPVPLPLRPSRILDSPLKFWAPHCWKITAPLSASSSSSRVRILSRSHRLRTNVSRSLFSFSLCVSLSFSLPHCTNSVSLSSPSSSHCRIHHLAPVRRGIYSPHTVPYPSCKPVSILFSRLSYVSH